MNEEEEDEYKHRRYSLQLNGSKSYRRPKVSMEPQMDSEEEENSVVNEFLSRQNTL